MSAFLDRLNALAASHIELRETIKLSALVINKPHLIESAHRVNTQFGPSVVIDIAEPKASIFLPRRYADAFTDIELHSMKKLSVHLISKGPYESGQGTQIEFVK